MVRNKTSIIFLVVIKVNVPKKDYHIAKDYNSQNSNMDFFFPYHILHSKLPMSFIRCSKHKNSQIL
jgi:hypothetical protein